MSLIERCPHFRGENVNNPNVIQWNLSIVDTLGTEKVSLIERCPPFGDQNAHNPNIWDDTNFHNQRSARILKGLDWEGSAVI